MTLVVSFCVLIEDPGDKVDIPNVKFRQHGFDDRRISLFSFENDGCSSVGFCSCAYLLRQSNNLCRLH